MNSIHNNGPDDKLLNDNLEKLGQAYQQISSEEPPELLDQAILSSAHRAVESKDHWLDFGWIHGLTTAVVVVLAFSIILTQRQPTGMEENGLSPADVTSLGRSRNTEPEMSGKLREQTFNEAEHKQELAKEADSESRKDKRQTIPAANTPQVQPGSRAEPMAARAVQDDSRAKKALTSEDAPLEEEIMQVNTAAEAMSAKPAVVEFADESGVAEVDDGEIDAFKTDADKHSVERLRLSDEETQLEAILMLKQAGDERWKAELEVFIENNPDYTLPDELKN